MTFRETLREFLRRTREILDNNRAEGNISWIDDVMYFIENVISNEASAMPPSESTESNSTEKAS